VEQTLIAQGPVDVNVRPAIAPRPPSGPIDRAVRAASGTCIDNLDGTLTVSCDWLCDYSRLLLQQACEARLRSLGTVVSGGSSREAVEDFLKPNALAHAPASAGD